jgi:hypothetical protein
MSERPEPRPGKASLAGDFEQSVLECRPSELEGTWIKFQSKNNAVAGEIIECWDGPHGIRRITIERDGAGTVKAIPLWFLDGIWDGFKAEVDPDA